MKDYAQYDDESKLTTRLKSILKDVSGCIDDISKDQKLKLLLYLENWFVVDRRRHPRKPCSLEVYCTVNDQVFTDFISNISLGGVFLRTSVALRFGESIALRLKPRDREERIEVSGQVAWTSPIGAGVKFEWPPSKQLQALIESL